MRQIGEHYFALKDRLRQRAGGVCEYCDWRFGSVLHHRWYHEDYYTGSEPMESVMFVCRVCHAAIHRHRPWRSGKPPSMTVRAGSLSNQGDTGLSRSDEWDAYLKGREPFNASRIVDDSDPRRALASEIQRRRQSEAIKRFQPA